MCITQNMPSFMTPIGVPFCFSPLLDFYNDGDAPPHIFFIVIFLFIVTEIRHERIAPTFMGATLNDATEFTFQIPPSSDYFTR